MKFTFTLLCENSVAKATTALAEHGFSCLLETPEGKISIRHRSGEYPGP